ncbi:hypothetical protein H1R17_01785 [Flavobacterium sp. xlx-214]|uniref:lipoprotein n=1 Tax=unclassified Flavobacterium TaxID=196869 RepID=UPI0013D0F4DD|nr:MULTISPECIES: lipoprotein [unclassified Flavobacterium]MBA5792753.1 hypothetical protein [Flavobacterium sp. xlx-221]QMI83890.1 hypothetical protein H1R17_01785 [Flavobacterium sp. xlx-214]
MKKIIVYTLTLFAVAACNNLKSNSAKNNEQTIETATQETQPSIGGQKDAHDCLTAAGQTWSELKQNCIQVFKEGQRLNPVNQKSDEAVISAFVVFNDAKTKVELFLPNNDKTTIILDKTTADVYQNKEYVFNAKEIAIYINGKKMYAVANQ